MFACDIYRHLWKSHYASYGGIITIAPPPTPFFIISRIWLRNAVIITVVFTGIATEFRIESSARDAFNRGFYSVVVSDCVSSPDKDGHNRSLDKSDDDIDAMMYATFSCIDCAREFKLVKS